MHIATISSQRQITLPKAMLDQLSLSVKDRVKITVDNNQLVVEPANMKIANLAGCLTHLIPSSKRDVSYQVAKEKALEIMVKKWVND